MAFHWLFPTPVLQVDLTPEAGVAAAMEAQLVTFDREVFAHPEFIGRNNLTGDLLGRAGLDRCIDWSPFNGSTVSWPCM